MEVWWKNGGGGGRMEKEGEERDNYNRWSGEVFRERGENIFVGREYSFHSTLEHEHFVVVGGGGVI